MQLSNIEGETLSSKEVYVQSQQMKLSNMWNMFKVNDKV